MKKTETGGTVAFTCKNCGRDYGDPLYRGPVGHCPPNTCLDCWYIEWEMLVLCYKLGRDPRPIEQALWLIGLGVPQTKAAELIHVHRNTLGRWIRHYRKYPHTLPEWCLPTQEAPDA